MHTDGGRIMLGNHNWVKAQAKIVDVHIKNSGAGHLLSAGTTSLMLQPRRADFPDQA
jgi:hypothetical protein